MMTLKRIRAQVAGAVPFFATLGVVALHAAPAAAWPSDHMADPEHREVFCPLLSGPSCTHTFLFDVLFEYQRDINDYPGSKNLLRLGGEVGYLVRLGSLSSQLGMVTEGGGYGDDDMGAGYVAQKLRLRWWPMHWFIGVELSGGALYTAAHYVTAGIDIQRWGAQVDLGVTLLGAFTVVMGGDWLRSPDGVSSGAFFIGARASFVTVPWGLLRGFR
jgi:hypothetical protein